MHHCKYGKVIYLCDSLQKESSYFQLEFSK